MSETIAGTPPPDRRPVRPSMTSLEIVAESLSLLRQSLSARWDVWLVAAIFFTGTDVVDIVFASPGGPFRSPVTAVSLIVRVIALVWVVAAAIRGFTGQRMIWTVNLPMLRCAVAFAGLLVLSVLLLFGLSHFITRPLIGAMTHDPQANQIASLLVLAIWLVVFAIVTVRLSPWIAALAIGDNAINLSAAWKGMRGATLAAIGALVWTSPVPIAHLVFTAQAQYMGGLLGLILTVIDGLVSVVQILLAMAIAAALYRFVKTNLPGDHFPA